MAERDFLVHINMNQNQILNMLLHLIAGDAGSPVDGQVWLNTSTNEVRVRVNGTVRTVARLDHRLDQFAAPTASVSMGSQKITNLADGTAANDAVNKSQLDAAAAGLDPKGSVRVATTAAGTLASSFENGDAIDGVTLATGDRILIKNQAAGAENGIYTVNASGAPTRATDADTSAEVNAGMFVFVEEGTTNGDTGWVLTTNNPITLGTTALVFSKFTAAATGVNKFSTSTHASATAVAITHNLGTTAVIAKCYDNSTGIQEEAEVVITDGNTVTFNFNVAPSANSKRFVVIG